MSGERKPEKTRFPRDRFRRTGREPVARSAFCYWNRSCEMSDRDDECVSTEFSLNTIRVRHVYESVFGKNSIQNLFNGFDSGPIQRRKSGFGTGHELQSNGNGPFTLV